MKVSLVLDLEVEKTKGKFAARETIEDAACEVVLDEFEAEELVFKGSTYKITDVAVEPKEMGNLAPGAAVSLAEGAHQVILTKKEKALLEDLLVESGPEDLSSAWTNLWKKLLRYDPETGEDC